MTTHLLNTSRGSNGKFSIGKHTYGSITIEGNHLLDEMIIGKFCCIGAKVSVLVEGWSHNTDWISTYPFEAFGWTNRNKIKKYPRTKRSVHIGNDVWIGHGSLIMSGVTIGDGAVIGANTVVSKDVPPYTVAVGNSIRFIKKRFSDEDIAFLLDLKWWNWSDVKINQNLEIINSSNINLLK